MADPPLIHLGDLPLEVADSGYAANHDAAPGEMDHLMTIERAHIVEVLARERGNKARAARALGINRRSLYRLIEKYGIGAAPPRSSEGCGVPLREPALRLFVGCHCGLVPQCSCLAIRSLSTLVTRAVGVDHGEDPEQCPCPRHT